MELESFHCFLCKLQFVVLCRRRKLVGRSSHFLSLEPCSVRVPKCEFKKFYLTIFTFRSVLKFQEA